MVLGCRETVEDPASYLKICDSEKGGLVQSRFEDGARHSLRYRPTDYFEARSMIGSSDAELSSIGAKTRAEFGPNFYFLFSVRLVQDSNASWQAARELEMHVRALERSNHGMQERIALVDRDNDTLPCILAVVQPDWAGHSGFDVLMVFKRGNNARRLEDLRRMVLRDFGNRSGIIEFELESIRPKYRFVNRKEGGNV